MARIEIIPPSPHANSRCVARILRGNGGCGMFSLIIHEEKSVDLNYLTDCTVCEVIRFTNLLQCYRSWCPPAPPSLPPAPRSSPLFSNQPLSSPRRSGPKRLGSERCSAALTALSPHGRPSLLFLTPGCGEVSVHTRPLCPARSLRTGNSSAQPPTALVQQSPAAVAEGTCQSSQTAA